MKNFKQITYFLIVFAFCGVFSLSAEDRKPNIIFIMADDLGYGDVGFNGQEHIQTPNLDKMAQKGIVFTSHYSGSTVCMPSRASLMSGMHTGHGTARGNPKWNATGKFINLSLDDDVTVAEELKRAGYATAIIGKWGLAEGGDDANLPQNRGFDYFYGYRGHGDAHSFYPPHLWRNDQKEVLEGNNHRSKKYYSHDLLAEDALKYIRSVRDKSFFLYLAYTIPHLPISVPDDSKEQYKNLGWPIKKMNDRGHYKNDPEGNTAYAGMVSRMDKDIGRMMELLEELNLADKTLVMFTSDNGPHYEKRDRFFNSNGPFRGGKRDLYEGGVRVPFVATWPGTIDPGTKSDHISAFWDLLPTACEIAGIEPSKKVDGISFLPTLVGNENEQKKHKLLYWEFNEGQGPIQAIRKDNWKAVKYLEKPVEIYNLDKDPGEKNNLAESNPEMAKQLLSLLQNTRTEDPNFPLRKLRK